jgi:excisionase family DNA binding protein
LTKDAPASAPAQFYSVAQVADSCGVSTDTIRSEIKTGALVAYRIGRQLRVRERDFEAYLGAHRYIPRDRLTQTIPASTTRDFRW